MQTTNLIHCNHVFKSFKSLNTEKFHEIFQKRGLEIFQNFHEIFKYFKLKYFIVHLELRVSFWAHVKYFKDWLIAKWLAGKCYVSSGTLNSTLSLTHSASDSTLHLYIYKLWALSIFFIFKSYCWLILLTIPQIEAKDVPPLCSIGTLHSLMLIAEPTWARLTRRLHKQFNRNVTKVFFVIM